NSLTILYLIYYIYYFFFFQAEDGIRDFHVTGVQTCALPIYRESVPHSLSHGINICFYPCVIMRIKITGTSITALYSIGNKYSSILIAKCTNRLKKRNRSLSYPADALYALDDYSTNLITKIL